MTNRSQAAIGRQEGKAMSRGHILETVRARPYRALTVEDLKVLLDGHDPASPVLLRDRRGGLLALNDIQSRPMPRHGAAPGSRSTDSATQALELASPAGDAVDGAPAVDLFSRLVNLLMSVWLRIESYAANNVRRQFHRLDREDDEHSL